MQLDQLTHTLLFFLHMVLWFRWRYHSSVHSLAPCSWQCVHCLPTVIQLKWAFYTSVNGSEMHGRICTVANTTLITSKTTTKGPSVPEILYLYTLPLTALAGPGQSHLKSPLIQSMQCIENPNVGPPFPLARENWPPSASLFVLCERAMLSLRLWLLNVG